MKIESVAKVTILSALAVGVFSACGVTSEQNAQSQSLRDELEMARKVVVKCNSGPSAEDSLALELSKTCREQNEQLKARGLASCGEDYCTDMVSMKAQRYGYEMDRGDNGEVEFLVTISAEMLSIQKEKEALICYAPVLKARELTSSLSKSCK